jgi:hypothetical protein
MAKQKKEQDEELQHRQIPSTPSNLALFEFLTRLFYVSPQDAEPGKVKSGVDACPQRLVLRSVGDVGTGREVVGPVVEQEEFRPTTDAIPNLEQLVALANRFDAAAQNEANVAQRRITCTLQAFSHAKGSEPYSRFVLAKAPTGIETTSIAEDTSGAHSLAEREMELRNQRFNSMLQAQMVSDYRDAMINLVGMYEKRLGASEIAQQELLRAHVAVVSLKEDLLDRSADRALRVKKEMNREASLHRVFGVRQNFALPAALAHWLGPATAMQIIAAANAGTDTIAPTMPNTAGDAPVHPLVAQLRQFLTSLDDNQRLALIGDWDGTTCKAPGELSVDQCMLIDGVASATLPVVRLRNFIASLTPEQANAAKQLLSPTQLQTLMALAVAANQLPEEPPPAVEATVQ